MPRFLFHPAGRLALAIFLTALLVRAVYLWQYVHSPLFGHHGVDHQYYLDWVRRIAAGNWLGHEVFEQGPLYAYLLGTVFSIIGERLVPVLAGQLLIGACGCVLVYACGRRLFDEPTAALAGFAAALYGPLMFYECAPMKTFLAPSLSLLALYAGLRYGEGRLLWLALAGIAVGVLIATGRYDPAAIQFRRARAVPNRESVREELLRYELAVVSTRAPLSALAAADSPLRAETIAAIEELRSLAPGERLEWEALIEY